MSRIKLNKIPVIELSGTPKEMGEQFGAKYKDAINQFADKRMSRLRSFVKRYGKIDVSEQKVLEIAETLLPAHQKFDTDTWQEFEAISKAADISLSKLLVVNGYTDLRDYICKNLGFNDIEVRFEGCTGFIIDKTMSVDNKIIIGQTWDMSVEAMDYLAVVKKNPSIANKPKSMYLTTVGALGLIGLNNNNIAIGTTNLMANDCMTGVNYLFTINKALGSTDYDSMVRSICEPIDSHNTVGRMSGHSFLCASSSKANLIEASAQDYVNYPLDHYPLVRTNNYSEAMRKHEIFIPEARRRNSIFRYGRVLSLLVDKPKWSNQDLWQVLSDDYRSAAGGAICNEDYNGKFGEFATCATILLIPEDKQMWVCRGGAKSSEIQVIDL